MTESTPANEGSDVKSAAELKDAYEKQRTFLLNEISNIEKVLEPLKGDKAQELRDKVAYRKEELSQEDPPFFLLFSAAKDINELKERVESLMTRQNPLMRISAPVWFSLVPALIVLYVAVLSIMQSGYKSDVHATQTAQALVTVTATVTSTPAP